MCDFSTSSSQVLANSTCVSVAFLQWPFASDVSLCSHMSGDRRPGDCWAENVFQQEAGSDCVHLPDLLFSGTLRSRSSSKSAALAAAELPASAASCP